MAGLKTLAKELQSKGRYGDTILAHINPQEAGILKALGGSGTRNPDTGLPEFIVKTIKRGVAALNPFNPGSALNKGINQIPVVGDINKAANDLGTKIFQPVEKAIVQPVSKGLSEFDKQVARTIPGGWGTVGSVALSAMGAPLPLQVAYGAARGGGLLRTGSSLQRTNLQGAVIGGATAYAQAKLGEYFRDAAPPGAYGLPESASIVDKSAPLVDGASSGLPAGVDPGYFDVPPTALSSAPPVGDFANSLSDPTAGMAQAYTPPPPPPSFLDKIATGTGDAVSRTAKFVTEAPTTGVSEAGRTLSGIGNLLSGGKSLSTVDPFKMGAMALYGETSLSGLEEQRKYLEEAKRANAINQAEYDKALGEINRQRDYADKVVRENPFNPNPDRDVSIGETFYRRGGADESLYGRAPDSGSTLYAMGGQVDDELGGDYSAMGMDQGNMQKGLFGKGYAAGGGVKVLPDLGPGHKWNIEPYQGTREEEQAAMAYNQANNIQTTGGVAAFNNQPTGQSMFSGAASMQSGFSQGAQISPSSNQNPNINMGGFAGPSSFYGGGGGGGFGGGGGGPFPLEGQYGIVKMAAGGMPPRFLSGGGDGMSDSIKANINGKQEARLADGEFVIPADVVSHLGNGSSKAGAKQLYAMMDRVRSARTGRKSQGKQINPRKYMTA